MRVSDVEQAPTDPLINFLRCYIAHHVPDETAVAALKQAVPIVSQAARIIRRKE